MKPPATQALYRAVRRNPPDDRDYVTPQERLGDPPADLSDEERRSWDALSFYDSAEGVRQMARQLRHPSKFVARYDFPLGTRVTWQETLEPGQFDVCGDMEIIKRSLTDDIEPL